MIYIVIAVIAASVVIDQVLKMIVVNTLDIGQTVPLIESVFHFTYVQNFGAAFSILQNKQIFLIIITLIAILAAVVILLKNINRFSKLLSFSLALVIGGGIGNLADRILNGFVVDFIDVQLINFPVFNFADCCVVLGAIGIILAVFISERKEKSGNNNVSD